VREVERDVSARLVAWGDAAGDARRDGHDDVVVVWESAARAATVDVLVAVVDDGVGVFDREVVGWAREGDPLHDCGVGYAGDGWLGRDCRSVLQAEVARDRRARPVIEGFRASSHDHAVSWLSRASRVLAGGRRRPPDCSCTRAARFAVRLFGIRRTRSTVQPLVEGRPVVFLDRGARRLSDLASRPGSSVCGIDGYGPWCCMGLHISGSGVPIRPHGSGSSVAQSRVWDIRERDRRVVDAR
jgi:hypothetical protein